MFYIHFQFRVTFIDCHFWQFIAKKNADETCSVLTILDNSAFINMFSVRWLNNLIWFKFLFVEQFKR